MQCRLDMSEAGIGRLVIYFRSLDWRPNPMFRIISYNVAYIACALHTQCMHYVHVYSHVDCMRLRVRHALKGRQTGSIRFMPNSAFESKKQSHPVHVSPVSNAADAAAAAATAAAAPAAAAAVVSYSIQTLCIQVSQCQHIPRLHQLRLHQLLPFFQFVSKFSSYLPDNNASASFRRRVLIYSALHLYFHHLIPPDIFHVISPSLCFSSPPPNFPPPLLYINRPGVSLARFNRVLTALLYLTD